MRAQATARGFAYLVDVTITSRHDGTRQPRDAVTDDQLARSTGARCATCCRRRSCRTEERFPCNCARGNCAITVTGDVQPCVSVPWSAGNVRDQPFIDIWRYSPVFQKIRGLRIADYEACAPCPDKPSARATAARRSHYSGSYTGTDPFVCKTAGDQPRGW
jgi:MoaA/NifB/PqqE/SkfB family radical SAM enzyme